MVLKKSKEQNHKTTPDEFLVFQKDNLLIEQLKALKENCILDKKKFTPLFKEMIRLNILLMSMK